MNVLKSTLLHTLEFILVMVLAWAIMELFNLNAESSFLVTGTVITAFVKYARASDKVPLKDYVNPKE
jgi:hypothetical protein